MVLFRRKVLVAFYVGVEYTPIFAYARLFHSGRVVHRSSASVYAYLVELGEHTRGIVPYSGVAECWLFVE